MIHYYLLFAPTARAHQLVNVTDVEKKVVWEHLAAQPVGVRSAAVSCAVVMTEFFAKHRELTVYSFESEHTLSELEHMIDASFDINIAIIQEHSVVVAELPSRDDEAIYE